MPIPPFNEHGLLPEGIHDCTLAEIEARLGGFQGSDRRLQLWARFTEFFAAAKASQLIEELLVDGSFVTANPDPNDIDLVLVVSARHDFTADLPPSSYNVLAQQRVRRRFGFDIVVVKNGTENLVQASECFAQLRQRPALKKDTMRIRLCFIHQNT